MSTTIRFFELKMIRKEVQAAPSRNGMVPAGLSFAQLALVLEEMLEIPRTNRYEFVFLHLRERLIDGAMRGNVRDSGHLVLNASDTFIGNRLLSEAQFLFRALAEEETFPEYRVEVVRAYENVYLGEKEKMLSFPVVLFESVEGKDPFWANPGRVNQRMRTFYFLKKADSLEEHSLDELAGAIRAGQKGLSVLSGLSIADDGGRDVNVPVLRASDGALLLRMETLSEKGKADPPAPPEDAGRQKTKGSGSKTEAGNAKSRSGSGADQNRGKGASSGKGAPSGKAASGKTSIGKTAPSGKTAPGKKNGAALSSEMMKQMLLYTKQELELKAEEFGLRVSGVKKEVAAALIEFLLKPETMKLALLEVPEEDLDLFERVMMMGFFSTSAVDDDRLDPFIRLFYLMTFENDTYKVPREVASVYQELLFSGYRDYHSERRWLMDCVYYFEVYYRGESARLLYEMYRTKEKQGSYETFLEFFEREFGEGGELTGLDGFGVFRVENDVIVRGGEENSPQKPAHLEIGPHVPTKTQITELAKNGYPSSESIYMGLEARLCAFTGWHVQEGRELCRCAFRTFVEGGDAEEALTAMQETGFLSIDGRYTKAGLLALLESVRSRTRLPELAGHTQEEMDQWIRTRPGLWARPKGDGSAVLLKWTRYDAERRRA